MKKEPNEDVKESAEKGTKQDVKKEEESHVELVNVSFNSTSSKISDKDEIINDASIFKRLLGSLVVSNSTVSKKSKKKKRNSSEGTPTKSD